jgi:hypothetical protein
MNDDSGMVPGKNPRIGDDGEPSGGVSERRKNRRVDDDS